MKPGAFVPEILPRYDREEPWVEWLRGAVLFVDVSGFTPMSETLAVLGAEGAEILTDKLNHYFASMIKILHAHGGQVMKFGGDALLCFFPDEDLPQRPRSAQRKGKDAGYRMPVAGCRAALSAATWMQRAMERFRNIRTPVRKFTLQMKIGIAEGEVVFAAIGDPAVRCDTVFAGKPVDLASQAEHHARPGDIVVASTDSLRIKGVRCRNVAQGFYRLRISAERGSEFGARGPGPGAQESRNQVRNPQCEIRSFLIGDIYDMVEQGYQQQAGALLRIVPMFMQFSGFTYSRRKLQLQRLHEFFAAVLRITHEHGGQLNRISMGDKGSTFLLLFGAPQALEKKEERACQCALEVEELVRNDFPGISLRTGMTTGRVFAGIVGGNNRFEYTVMGDTVNLAARLMQGARARQICVSEEFARAAESQFEFRSLGARRVKGKTAPLQVFELTGRRSVRKEGASTTVFAGRQLEIEQLLSHLQAVRRGAPRFVVIEGEAGQGKSLLAEQILQTARRDGWKVATGKGEITRHNRTYAPWESVLENCGLRIADFGIRDSGLGTRDSCGPSTKSAMDEESQKNLLHHRISSSLQKKLKPPTVIFLDDLHWFDTLSLDLLASLLNHLRREPVLILGATRSQWPKDNFVNRSTFHLLPLGEMDRAMLKEMAQQILGGAVRDALVDFVYDRSHGNPFFSKQVIDYLKAKDLLVTRLGEWTIQRMADVHESLTGEEVIVARLDQLTLPERTHLELAACMGPTFSRKVLQKALDHEFQPAAFDALRTLGYFQQVDEDRVTFPHALVQETLYHDLPQSTRKQAHRKIGLAMEAVFAKRLDDYLPNLANHFYLAGARDKAIDYSIASGESLTKQLSFPEASLFFEQANHLLRNSPLNAKKTVAIALANALLRSAELKKALEFVKRLETAARKARDRETLNKSSAIKFDIMQRLSDYSYVTKASRLLKNHTAQEHHAAIRYFLAVAYYHRGWFGKASRLFKASISQSLNAGNYEKVYLGYLYLSSIMSIRGDATQAIRILMDGISAAKKTSNPYQQIQLELKHANVLLETHHFGDARRSYLGLLRKVESLGDLYLTGLVLLGLGELETECGSGKVAEEYLEESHRIFSSLGAAQGQGQAIMDKGILLFYQGEFEAAHCRYLEAVTALKTAGEDVQMCWGYYNLAEVSARLGRTKEAIEWLRKGVRSFNKKDDPALAEQFKLLRTTIKNRASQ